MGTGHILIIIGNSGVGKTALAKYATQFGGVKETVSTTTRSPRVNEVDGVDYHFVDDATFDAMIANDEFAEYASFGDFRYGTTKKELEEKIAFGNVILVLEIEGARQIQKVFPGAIIIGLYAKEETLIQRMIDRGDSPEKIQKRKELFLSADKYEEIAEILLRNEDTEVPYLWSKIKNLYL